MNRTGLLLSLLFCLLLTISCQPREKKKIVIGLSQCMLDDAWRQAMIRETLIEAANYDDLEVVIRNADTNNKQQIEQVRELINMGVDVLIISPNEGAPLTPIAEEAYNQGIPTIITDRKIAGDRYTTFVGASNYQIGKDAGKYAAGYLPKDAIILEVWGLSTSSPAQERHEGFVEAMIGRPDVSFIKLEGEWRYDTASVRLNRMPPPEKIDLVYAHNDMMAIAAREYLLKLDPVAGAKVHIIGVDAAPGAGLEAVADGRIDVSFIYPRGGEQVIRAAIKLARGEQVDKDITLHTAQVDKDVARTLLLQADQLNNYQKQIEGQRSRLDELFGRYNFLQNSIAIISLLMIGFVGLTIYVFRINRKMQKSNQALIEKSRIEEEQHMKLLALNAEIKEITAQKLQIFTNVSHEVRTPLTLILAPLDRLIGLLYNSPYFQELELIHKNAERLLRVINQILDFRKIENQQDKLKIRETEMVSFTREVMVYFDSMARNRHMNYTFHTELKSCLLWIDPDHIEKALVNLLSNAFKFTPDHGHIRIELSEKGDKVLLTITDDGTGIRPENLPYIFQRFHTNDSSTGTGIGLHLVNEYVRMHHGEISVESIPGKETVFTIALPKGREHLNDTDITILPVSPLSYEASVLDRTEVDNILSQAYPYRILVVEDDDEVRNFLAGALKEQFTILTASNGKEALEVLDKEDISLVLSDVMMPELNGFELCRSIKTNLSYSHIPVILITALTDEWQRLYGVSRGADGYIQKPFRIEYVKVKIIRLLEERERLHRQFLQKLRDNHHVIIETEQLGNIDDLFLRRLLEQLEEVYTDSEFNVERLSDLLCISRGHLYRKVKEITGITPVEFLRNFRLGKAVGLLRERKLSVSEIAYQTGFTSPSYFTKCFKTVYNTTPTEFI